MQQMRFWKPRVVVLTVPPLALAGAEAQAPHLVGQGGSPVMGLIEKYRDHARGSMAVLTT